MKPISLAKCSLAASAQAASESLAPQWRALHRAAGAVALLAGASAEPMTRRLAGFPDAVARNGGCGLVLARQGVADLAAMMEPRLVALIALYEGGANPQPAAQALLHEFRTARDALLMLLEPG